MLHKKLPIDQRKWKRITGMVYFSLFLSTLLYQNQDHQHLPDAT
jgi:hypothetical protein